MLCSHCSVQLLLFFDQLFMIFETIPDIGAILVFIASTGIEQDLSAPIDFCLIPEAELLDKACDSAGRTQAIETSLRAAIDFLILLEQREAGVFGFKPDPVESTRNKTLDRGDPIAAAARELGWDNDAMGLLHGPSSAWVDTGKYHSWTGRGVLARKAFENVLRFFRRAADFERDRAKQFSPEWLRLIKQQSRSATLISDSKQEST